MRVEKVKEMSREKFFVALKFGILQRKRATLYGAHVKYEGAHGDLSFGYFDIWHTFSKLF